MKNPEKFNEPEEKEKEKVEFMGWRETMQRKIDGNRVLSGENHNKFLNNVDPYSPYLTIEDMRWEKRISKGDFDPEEFKKYQTETSLKFGKNHPKTNFMRSLIKSAEEALKQREFVNRFKK